VLQHCPTYVRRVLWSTRDWFDVLYKIFILLSTSSLHTFKLCTMVASLSTSWSSWSISLLKWCVWWTQFPNNSTVLPTPPCLLTLLEAMVEFTYRTRRIHFPLILPTVFHLWSLLNLEKFPLTGKDAKTYILGFWSWFALIHRNHLKFLSRCECLKVCLFEWVLMLPSVTGSNLPH